MGREATLAWLLPAAAERDPDGLAIRDQGSALTWSDAATRSGRIAAGLAVAGVQPGDRVGVHYRKCADALLAMHAVVQRGAVAVPLDPGAPVGYLSSVASQAGCRALLTHPACRRSALGVAAAAGVEALVGIAGDGTTPAYRVVDGDWLAAAEPAPPVDVAGSAPAYIITTSGSTGRPKGICHTHRSALAYVEAKLAAYDLGPADRISDIAPNHFDISTMALWVAPAVGAANVVVPEQHQMLPASLSQLAADERISVWYSVPYLLTQLLARGNLAERDLSCLRWVLFGGEVFPPAVLAELMSRLPSARFSNVYGPAEVNACTVHHLPGPPEGDDPVPIGRPVAGAEVRLAGERHDRVGSPLRGEPREIWVRTPAMMTGYWGRPDLDRQVFVDGDDGRWYRTGDLGFLRSDGQLVFAGRIDHQVKVRGHRVELESIESLLEGTAGIASAVAAVVRAGDGSDVVVAGLAPVPGTDLDHGELRRQLADQLPAYAVPAAFYPVDTVPTTGSGKIDRRAVRAGLALRHDQEGDGARV